MTGEGHLARGNILVIVVIVVVRRRQHLFGHQTITYLQARVGAKRMIIQ